jgi:excisionase family DNA binding protein
MSSEAKAKPTCLLTTEQAAADLSMSTRTLLRLRKMGAIRAINVGAGDRTHWRFDSDALDRFKREREQAVKPSAPLPAAKRERKPPRRRLASPLYV